MDTDRRAPSKGDRPVRRGHAPPWAARDQGAARRNQPRDRRTDCRRRPPRWNRVPRRKRWAPFPRRPLRRAIGGARRTPVIPPFRGALTRRGRAAPEASRESSDLLVPFRRGARGRQREERAAAWGALLPPSGPDRPRGRRIGAERPRRSGVDGIATLLLGREPQPPRAAPSMVRCFRGRLSEPRTGNFVPTSIHGGGFSSSCLREEGTQCFGINAIAMIEEAQRILSLGDDGHIMTRHRLRHAGSDFRALYRITVVDEGAYRRRLHAGPSLQSEPRTHGS